MSTKAADLVIRKTVTVDASLEHAFRVFTDGIGSWWPLEKHSVRSDLAQEAVFESKIGGRVYERWEDGHENWGEVLVWEPPRRIVFSWQPNKDSPAPTEVEVRFSEEGGTTRVDLEHRGWERLGEQAQRAREGYDSGWPGVLERFAEVAGSS